MTSTPGKFGPIRLAPGVTPRHVGCYLFAAFISIGLYTYLIALTPYVLTVNLGLPRAEHGRISGDLQFWQEVVLLATLGLWGALSDRLGRRLVYSLGFLIIAVAYALYAFATAPPQLVGFRLVFALGVAATSMCLSAILADYPEEKSRGTLTGIAFSLNGVGSVLFVVGLTRLPEFFTGQGAAEIWAGRYAYLIVGGIALLAAGVMLGLKPGRPDETDAEARTPVLRLLAEGITAGRNARIALSYVSAFAARMNMAIVTLFLFLWAVQAATAEGGGPAEATARAGLIVGVSQLSAVLSAPVVGMIGDKVDRLTLQIGAFAVAALGYGWLAVLGDILAWWAIPALLLAGVGLSSGQLASTVLLADESPVRLRGSTFGVQAFFGALGILTLSAVGGRLFDGVGPHAAFALVAGFNLLVLLSSAARRAMELSSGRPGGAGSSSTAS